MLPFLLATLSPAHADPSFRVGACLSDPATDCLFAGITAEYGTKTFSVGITPSFIIPTLMLNTKAYLNLDIVRPFVGLNGGYYAGPGLIGVLYGPSLGVDIHLQKFIVRAQMAYTMDGHAGALPSIFLHTPVNLGASFLWKI